MAFLPLKKYGQHFLEPAWADKLVAAIQARPDDRFVEIGPGPGALTLRLAPLVSHVTAVEVDREMVAALRPTLPPNVTLVAQNFLEFDLPAAARASGSLPLRVAGNLPYNVASPILFKLLAFHRAAGPGTLADATVMIQREVADRILAEPGTRDYGVLTILVRLHARAERLLSLPPGAFRPPPKVHSSVVRLTFGPPSVSLANEAAFEAMVRTMFTQRRKTLANALRPFAASRQADAAVALAAAGIDPRRRPETLQLPELARLADYFASA